MWKTNENLLSWPIKNLYILIFSKFIGLFDIPYIECYISQRVIDSVFEHEGKFFRC